MTFDSQGAARWIAGALLLTVATQLFYIGVVANAGDGTILRPVTWMVETASFALIAAAAFVLTARSNSAPFAWAAIALSGIFNVLQAGMGLSMFGPAREAASPELFTTVLSGAFFFYFLAKVLIGLAAIGLGFALTRLTGIGRILGWLAVVAGVVAVVVNTFAMASSPGQDTTFIAGATGTAATLFLALVVWMLPQGDRAAHAETA